MLVHFTLLPDGGQSVPPCHHQSFPRKHLKKLIASPTNILHFIDIPPFIILPQRNQIVTWVRSSVIHPDLLVQLHVLLSTYFLKAVVPVVPAPPIFLDFLLAQNAKPIKFALCLRQLCQFSPNHVKLLLKFWKNIQL